MVEREWRGRGEKTKLEDACVWLERLDAEARSRRGEYSRTATAISSTMLQCVDSASVHGEQRTFLYLDACMSASPTNKCCKSGTQAPCVRVCARACRSKKLKNPSSIHRQRREPPAAHTHAGSGDAYEHSFSSVSAVLH